MVCIFYLLFEGWSHQLPRKLLVLIVIVSIQFTPWRDNCWKSSFDNLCYVLTIIDLNFFQSFVSRIWLNFDLLFLRAEHHFLLTCGCHQILLLPHYAPVMCFSRRWHQHFLFPRSVPASHFPAFGTSYVFRALFSDSPSCRCRGRVFRLKFRTSSF